MLLDVLVVFLLAQLEAAGVRGKLFPMEGAALGEVAMQEWALESCLLQKCKRKLAALTEWRRNRPRIASKQRGIQAAAFPDEESSAAAGVTGRTQSEAVSPVPGPL